LTARSGIFEQSKIHRKKGSLAKVSGPFLFPNSFLRLIAFSMTSVSVPELVSQLAPLTLEAAETLWNYHRLHHQLTPADGILVFGSNDLRVAEHAVELFKAGLGPWILFSGARGRMTEDWPETEAATMAALARANGVPDECVFVEDRATNTGENIRFSRELLANAGLALARITVVQKPYMERRTLAALDVQWRGVDCQVSSPTFGFAGYCTAELPPQLVIEAMVGDFQRILDYPALGFASEQAVPAEVLAAYHALCDLGFAGQLRAAMKA
jgi:uncharacterized SAM-binding protein YcdF (DUF218 family)